MTTRRAFFSLIGGAVAAPIVVRSGLLMPVKTLPIIAPHRPLVMLGSNVVVNSSWLDLPEHFRVVSMLVTERGTVEVEAVQHMPAPGVDVAQVHPSSISIDNPADTLIDVTTFGDDTRRFTHVICEPLRARFELTKEHCDFAPGRAA